MDNWRYDEIGPEIAESLLALPPSEMPPVSQRKLPRLENHAGETRRQDKRRSAMFCSKKSVFSQIFLLMPTGLLVLAVGVSCRKQPEPRPPVIAAAIVDTALSADGVPVVFEARGNGEPALVFIHGWCCDRGYWNAQVSEFSLRHQVVSIDLAGHGESGMDREEWTVAAFGQDVAAVVEQLGPDQAILIGHSMGGPVAAEAAGLLSGRVIGIIGVDNFNDVEQKLTDEELNAFFAPIQADFREGTANFIRQYMFTPATDSALIEWIVADMSSAPSQVGLSAFENLFKYDLASAVSKAAVPIRCINSDKYPVNPDAGKRHAPSFEVTIMPGVGHFPQLEDPETFNRHLNEAITELITLESGAGTK
jgi:pimeloyl-ACP methyl ester carboxylesterase